MRLGFFLIGLFLVTLSSCSESVPNSTSAPPTTQANTPPQTSLLYVDVREDEEWNAGHIQGAIHVKLSDIEAGKIDSIPKDQAIALYCRSGRRSGIAYDILSKAGYTHIQNAGGMDAISGVTIVQ